MYLVQINTGQEIDLFSMAFEMCCMKCTAPLNWMAVIFDTWSSGCFFSMTICSTPAELTPMSMPPRRVLAASANAFVLSVADVDGFELSPISRAAAACLPRSDQHCGPGIHEALRVHLPTPLLRR
jgi:hypothetical protein